MKHLKRLLANLLFVLLLCNISNYSFAKESKAPLKEMTVHVIPQSHIDLAWWWRYDPETIHVIVKHTLEIAFANMEKYPDYTFTFLQVPAIEPLENTYPELYYKFRYYVHNSRALEGSIRNPGARGTEGRLAIGSGFWCEVDGCLPCGESLVRQVLYGKRFFMREFGIDVKTAWFQDAWTHPWTWPQILKKSGIDSYMFTRPRGKGEQMFWWQSPDGSRVFAYKPFKSYGESLPAGAEMDERLLMMNQRYGVTDDITLVGVGNHGGGALKADVERMRKTMAARQEQHAQDDTQAKIIFSTPHRFVNAVMREKHNFPVVNNELTATIRGAYTTVGEIKKGNRYAENLLMTLEKFSAIASALGEREYPRAAIFSAWKKVMINQFHDTISGTDIPPAIDDALRRYANIMAVGRRELDKSLQTISSRINTTGKGVPIIVFNPLSWKRSDVVETSIEFPQPVQTIRIQDNEGNDIPSQIISKKKKGEKYIIGMLFIAEEVPSIGYKSYRAIPAGALEQHSTLKVNENEIENEFFKIEIDPSTGCMSSIFDKRLDRRILDKDGQGNLIQIIQDFGDSEGFLNSPQGEPEYNFWTGKYWNVDSEPEIEIVESGPVSAVVQIKKKFDLARFTQRIKIYAKIPRIDFDLVLDWQGKNKMVKVSFPLNVKSPQATYEIPYGAIQRPSIGEEQVARNWVDISQKDYGVSLLNDSRYGHDITENTIRLSVLRSPDHPVFATDEKGVHLVKYALYPHAGDWKKAHVMRRGYEFNNPLLAVVDSVHEGDLPAAHSFIAIEPENLIMTVLKMAEDSDDLILRFFDAEAQKSLAKVVLSDFLSVDAVHKTDLLENEVKEIELNGTYFKENVGVCSIESFKLIK